MIYRILKKKLKYLVMLCIVLNISVARADVSESVRLLDLLDVPVTYTAKFQVSDGHGTYLGSVWHERGKERRDVDTKVGNGWVLLRRDRDVAYFVNVSGKWCVSFGFHAAAALAGGIDALMATRQRVGVEKVGRVQATKYRVEAKAPSGQAFLGDMWMAASGVPIKVAGVETDAKGRKTPVELIQTDIALGPIEPSLLEAPTGMTTLDLKGVSADQLIPAIQSLGPLLGH